MLERRATVAGRAGGIGDGYRVCGEYCADLTRFQDVTQVRGEAVAQVDHGAQLNGRVQLLRFEHARRKRQVVPRQAAAEPSGDEDPVTRPRAAAGHRPPASGFTQHGDARDERTVPDVRISPGDRHVELIGKLQDAVEELLGEPRAA